MNIPVFYRVISLIPLVSALPRQIIIGVHGKLCFLKCDYQWIANIGRFAIFGYGEGFNFTTRYTVNK